MMTKDQEEKFENLYRESINDPEEFWEKIAHLLTWAKPWTKVLDNTKQPFTKWFVGGELNACYNALDRHVEAGNGDNIALIYDSPMTGIHKKFTYTELLEKVAKFAGVLAKSGIRKGDTVLIYMPAIPETLVAMLATARLGAVHSVVFGGFAARELCTRIQHCQPKAIIAADCGIEPGKVINYLQNLNQAMGLSEHKPGVCIIYQRKLAPISGFDLWKFQDWEEAMQDAEPHTWVPIEANEPLYILYTSGTTGEPKAIQRGVGGHLVNIVWSLKTIYGVGPGDVWWATSDLGWVVGHSYICYGPLISGTTSVLYDGKPTTTPNPAQFFRIISEYRVKSMFTVPTILRMIKNENTDGVYSSSYDLSSLKWMFVAGEHCDLNTKLWAEKIFNVPVYNHWWQTEIGHPITAPCVGYGQTVDSSSLSVGPPYVGFDIEILREDGTKAEPNQQGEIAIKLPMPPGTFSTLYKANERFVKLYFTRFPGYYDTMDAGYMDENGLIHVTARDDDVINVAGHRLSTLAMENIILSHPKVCDACVVSVPDAIKTEVPFCFFVTKDSDNEAQLVQELIQLVKNEMGPVASFKLAASVKALPQTRSGKICRKAIGDWARNKRHIPSTIVDASIFNEIEKVFIYYGYLR